LFNAETKSLFPLAIKTGERTMRTLSILTAHHHIPYPSPHIILEKIHEAKISGAFHRMLRLILSAMLAAALFIMIFGICARMHDEAEIITSYLEVSQNIIYTPLK
jgi:hypothetical protein